LHNAPEGSLKSAASIIPFLVLLEIYYVTMRARSEAVANHRYALLKQVPATFIWDIDESTLLMAGHFKALCLIFLADWMIAAYAARLEAVLVHKNPEFEALAGSVTREALPYK
jgi:predicted nucleic acid-binding protein